MDRGTLSVLIVAILTLVIVILSYFDLKASITSTTRLAARPTITVQGIGAAINFVTPGVNCSGSRAPIEAIVSIVAGGVGNRITATASCTQGGAPAIATATDPGNGLAQVRTARGGPGAGVASCDTNYTNTAAPNSAWTAVCDF